MSARTLLIRADASSEIGVGHVMRCAALAQAWQSGGGQAVFALAAGADELEERLCSWGAEVARIRAEPGSEEDAAQTIEFCQRRRAGWLVLDGYHFSQDYRANLRGGPRLLLMDDHGDCPPYKCDIVLNANPQASDTMYHPQSGQARFLLGPRYALVRQEFLEFPRDLPDVPDRARRILVTFGGADRQNATLKVVQALRELSDLQLYIAVVVGVSNPNRMSLLEAVDGFSNPARVLLNVENMPELMSQSDLAITAGGGTCFELAFMKVPMFLLTMAKNHEATVQAYGEAKAAVAAGWFDSVEREDLALSLRAVIVDRELRKRLREKASQIVDGRGAQRVVEVICSLNHDPAGK
jgi:UDP-2,4-diacetamido-2,4,6-trideoxy-beta-L-altropyranose hydrolase